MSPARSNPIAWFKAGSDGAGSLAAALSGRQDVISIIFAGRASIPRKFSDGFLFPNGTNPKSIIKYSNINALRIGLGKNHIAGAIAGGNPDKHLTAFNFLLVVSC